MFSSYSPKKKLDDVTCRQVRYDYFVKLEMLDTLSKDYNVGLSTLRKALHSRPPYDNVTDSIPDEIKKQRTRKGWKQRTRKQIALLEAERLVNIAKLKEK